MEQQADSVHQTSAFGVCAVPLGKPVCRSGRDWYEVEAYATPDAHLLTPKEYVVAVRAVNSHAKLVEALQDIFGMVGEQELKDIFGYEWFGQARNALAEATK